MGQLCSALGIVYYPRIEAGAARVTSMRRQCCCPSRRARSSISCWRSPSTSMCASGLAALAVLIANRMAAGSIPPESWEYDASCTTSATSSPSRTWSRDLPAESRDRASRASMRRSARSPIRSSCGSSASWWRSRSSPARGVAGCLPPSRRRSGSAPPSRSASSTAASSSRCVHEFAPVVRIAAAAWTPINRLKVPSRRPRSPQRNPCSSFDEKVPGADPGHLAGASPPERQGCAAWPGVLCAVTPKPHLTKPHPRPHPKSLLGNSSRKNHLAADPQCAASAARPKPHRAARPKPARPARRRCTFVTQGTSGSTSSATARPRARRQDEEPARRSSRARTSPRWPISACRVPPGFGTITTEVGAPFSTPTAEILPEGGSKRRSRPRYANASASRPERVLATLARTPLLVSVRSGRARLDARHDGYGRLNLGLNDDDRRGGGAAVGRSPFRL